MSPAPVPQPDALLAALSTVADPELGVGIVALGLIYEAHCVDGVIAVTLTLTSPTCPLGDVLLADVEAALNQAFPDLEVDLTLSFEPPWDPSRMNDAARAALE